MTILQVNKFYYLRSGAERYMLELSAFLESQGHSVIPFAMQHPQNLPTPYAAAFPRYVPTERPAVSRGAFRTLGRLFYSLEAESKMAGLLRATPIDLAHVHSVYAQLSPSVLTPLREKKVPAVMTVHDYHLVSPQYSLPCKECGGVDVSGMGVWRAAATRFHKRSYAASWLQAASFAFASRRKFYEKTVSLFLTPSDFLRRKMLESGFAPDRVRTIPHGIDPDLVKPRDDHDGYFLFVGRLVPEKGAETVVSLARILPDLKFKIVGTGPDEARLHRLGHGLPNLEFVGFRSGEDLADLYRGAMALLVPSRWEEVFGLTALEAFAAGKPVVASAVGGLPEVVEDRGTGFLVRPLDLHAWTEAVVRLAHDEELRRQMGRAARLSAETTFHIKRHYERVLTAYEDARRMRV
jgi:glycosyltransferase involved in cell wall biosynthesis